MRSASPPLLAAWREEGRPRRRGRPLPSPSGYGPSLLPPVFRKKQTPQEGPAAGLGHFLRLRLSHYKLYRGKETNMVDDSSLTYQLEPSAPHPQSVVTPQPSHPDGQRWPLGRPCSEGCRVQPDRWGSSLGFTRLDLWPWVSH